MTTTLDELEAQYSAEMTQKERASLEADIWSRVPKEIRVLTKHTGLVGYMQDRFETPQSKARARQFLHSAGPAADPLWERVEGDMTLHSALQIMQSARERAENGEDLAFAVQNCIAEYDNFGYASKSPDGKIVRRRLPGSNSPPPAASDPTPGGRAFWSFLRTHVMEYIKTRLPDADQHTRDGVIRRFEVDLNVLLVDLQKEISKAPKQGLKATIAVSRKSIIQACIALNMKPPKVGQPVDMETARLQRRRHARAYHPDSHGGSEATREQYQAVIEAFKLLETYNESLGTTDVPVNADLSSTTGENHGE